MTTTLHTADRAMRPEEQRTAAYADARALALELAGLRPTAQFDAKALGVVLRPDEAIYRRVSSWLFLFKDGHWGSPVQTDILVTNWGLLCRFAHGQLTNLPWTGLVGLHIDLQNASVVLDHGDGHPVCTSGYAAAVLAVAAVAFVYGSSALLSHPALAILRTAGQKREDGFARPGAESWVPLDRPVSRDTAAPSGSAKT